MGNVKKSVTKRTHHQRQYDGRVNKRQMLTQKSKIDTGKAVNDDLVVTESSGTESEVQHDNSRSGNDTNADDADIRPIYDEEPTAKENKTLKKHYKDLYDSIKITRSKTIEHTTSLLANNADLKAQIQEKVFAIAALKNDLRKLKGNNVDTKYAKTSVLGKPVLQSLRNQLVVRQLNAFKFVRPQMSKPRFAFQVDVNNNLSRPVTQHYFSNKRASAFAKPDHMIASSSSRNSSKNMPRFSSNDMVHNSYLEEARRKTQERNKNSKSSESNSRAKIQSNKTRNCNKPVDQKSHTQIPGRQIFIGHSFSPNKTSAVYEKTSPRSDLSKDDSEPTHGSNVDISKSQECKQTLDLNAELESLFGPSFDEYFNGKNKVVSKPSAVTTADTSDKRQQQPDSTSSSSTLATTVTADGNFDL
uniref:Uncharacterized protein n=1 Tax=Tanacetum cinerariifolium TaxID=118510 RepID=A0A6L2N911_TANCI|nr:hypothetical protein [Tanacetum cinerariifolium]